MKGAAAPFSIQKLNLTGPFHFCQGADFSPPYEPFEPGTDPLMAQNRTTGGLPLPHQFARQGGMDLLYSKSQAKSSPIVKPSPWANPGVGS